MFLAEPERAGLDIGAGVWTFPGAGPPNDSVAWIAACIGTFIGNQVCLMIDGAVVEDHGHALPHGSAEPKGLGIHAAPD
jgi:hypothetical protein